MAHTGQRTSVHGILDASREWQRIVELACRRGLAEVPAARPEFATVERVECAAIPDPAQPDRRAGDPAR